jgi:hypothetical protein
MCHRRVDIRIHNVRRYTRFYRSAVLEILRNDGGITVVCRRAGEESCIARSARWRTCWHTLRLRVDGVAASDISEVLQ